jgi:hypothetical protein
MHVFFSQKCVHALTAVPMLFTIKALVLIHSNPLIVMFEGNVFFILKLLPILALAALLFTWFGWWLRCKLCKCGATQAEVDAAVSRPETGRKPRQQLPHGTQRTARPHRG